MKAIPVGVRRNRPDRVSKVSVRPTSARVRAALFSMLAVHPLEGTRALDLYAGLGTLGMEAIRHGAQSCDFVESNARLCSDLKARLETAGMKGKGRVLCMKVERALSIMEGPYDTVFMDPPYEMPRLEETVERLARSSLIAQDGLLVVEHSKRIVFSESYGEMKHWRSRRYGDTVLDIYMKGEPE
jgi:16S rRNA (guanine966-N2)-methyltransferase